MKKASKPRSVEVRSQFGQALWSAPRLRGFGCALALILGACCISFSAQAQFTITEFMAITSQTLKDENGNSSDWIEIHNETAATNNLGGWYLSNKTNDLTQWQFPSTNLPPNGYLVVFASGKSQRIPGAPLHTSFKLSGSGEYLALIRPDGATIATEFWPAFPPQVTDVSYGLVRQTSPVTLLPTGAVARAFVPRDSSLGLAWNTVEFDDRAWPSGTTGVGYDRQPIGVNLLPLIGLNVGTAMYNSNATAYIRVPFRVDDPGQFSGLTLRVQFLDGFIASLNGLPVAASNAPALGNWNSTAPAPRTETAATNYVDFDVSDSLGSLVVGTNVLAFQALNATTNRQQLLLVPQLIALTPNGPPAARYFPVPTPGQPNNAGVATIGPVITKPQLTPAQPADADTLIVSARLRAALAAVGSATLRYRVMFGNEASLPMLDDGAHGDGAPGDGVYGASIPASASTPGQMVRWFITATDVTGTNVSRYPPFTDTNNSAAYLGTVIANPALTNPLPVFHWFVQNTAAADTTTGTRCSVYWNGEFYDNVFCRIRGASAPGFLKHFYKFDFNPGEHFHFEPGQPLVAELNVNSTQQDKAYVRAPLSFETFRKAGAPACDSFNVRVQQNSLFYSVAVFAEQVDQTFLQRRGLDPSGALYKMYNGDTSSTSGVEKKTRRSEDNSDLQAFFVGLSPGNPSRAAFVFDNYDLPALINYLAAGVIAQDLDRTFKNHYLYRDTEGTRLWTVLPWDKDLTFGLFGLGCTNVSGNDDSAPYTGYSGGYISHPLFGKQGLTYPNGGNNTFDAIYTNPVTLQMYLRRLRTLMDEFLQSPGTPAAQLVYEHRLDELAALLQRDTTLDLAKWGPTFPPLQTLASAMGAIKTNYLAQRRVHLYQTHSIDNVAVYPASARIPHAQIGSPVINFGAVEFHPASGNQAQEYIELQNPNVAAVDISGWRMAGAVDFTFAPGTVLPASGHLYLSPDVVAFRARTSGPRAGLGLLIVGNYQGQLSARGEALWLLDAAGLGIATNVYAGNPSPAQQFLRITELMYHPPVVATGNTNGPENFEYIELKNISPSATLDLSGVHFTNGIGFSFTGSAVTSLGPGQTVLVVKSLTAFGARYPGNFLIAGEFAANLSNAGEKVRLDDAAGEKILEFTYGNNWYPITDGLGFSLVVVDENAPWDTWGLKTGWRPSVALGGSPGVTDPPPTLIPPIVVNEVLSRTDVPPPTDSIELFNPTMHSADLSGWFITDAFNTPQKFRIPNGTTISAGGFRVFTESDFNPVPGSPPSFALSSLGDEAWLFSGDAQTNLTGYVHGFRFGAAENGVSFGRCLTSVGQEDFVAQLIRTLGASNAGPLVGPMVISEIQYHPSSTLAAQVTQFTPMQRLTAQQTQAVAATAETLKFIELQNITSHSLALFDPVTPTNTWRLRGDANCDFPTNITLGPGAVLLVVSFDPATNTDALAAFRSAYALGLDVPIYGPWSGTLSNSGACVTIEKPDVANLDTIPYILVDAVCYGASLPWPPAADGVGSSLQRLVANYYGNDPENWFADSPTPGIGSAIILPPRLAINAAGEITWPTQPAGFVLLMSESPTRPMPWPQADVTGLTEQNGYFKLTVPLTGVNRFYRLFKP